MPKGFLNINLSQRNPNRRRVPGPPPAPLQKGFRPSREKSRPPGWGKEPEAAPPAQQAPEQKPETEPETGKEK